MELHLIIESSESFHSEWALLALKGQKLHSEFQPKPYGLCNIASLKRCSVLYISLSSNHPFRRSFASAQVWFSLREPVAPPVQPIYMRFHICGPFGPNRLKPIRNQGIWRATLFRFNLISSSFSNESLRLSYWKRLSSHFVATALVERSFAFGKAGPQI